MMSFHQTTLASAGTAAIFRPRVAQKPIRFGSDSASRR